MSLTTGVDGEDGETCRVCGGHLRDQMGVRSDGIPVRQCQDCEMGVVATLPPGLAELYAGDYYASDRAGTGYEDYESTASHSLTWMSLLLTMISRPNTTVLDVGCADGRLLQPLKGHCRLLGVEPNPAMAATATAAGLSVVADDIFDPGLEDRIGEKCDVVTAIAVLEHLTDIRRGLEAMMSLLTDDGLLVFEVPLLRDEPDPVWFRTSLEHIWYPTEASLVKLFATQKGIHLLRLPSEVQTFGWTFFGVASRDRERLASVEELFQRALLAPVDQVRDEDEQRLRFLYDVIYRAAPSAPHITLLPAAIAEADVSLGLTQRLASLLVNRADRMAFLEEQYVSLSRALEASTSAYVLVEQDRDDQREQAGRWQRTAADLAARYGA